MPRLRKVPAGRFVELGAFGGPGVEGTRRVRAYVPHTPPGLKRPALYLFDGQNAFGDAGSFAGGWHAHEASDRLASHKPVAPVIVAIDHGHAARIDELSPFAMRGRGGKLDPLLDMIVHQVVPAANARFDLHDGIRAIGGSSMGGLAALYAHVRSPELFPRAICMSPSLWFGKDSLWDYLANRPAPYFARLYLDCGAREGGGRMLALVESFARHFAARGYVEGQKTDRRLMWRPDKRGSHNEKAWRRRLPKALRFAFE
jgi:predicted alpha/beta superfamily hydrolase